jgi:hypothetical protein
MEEQKMIILNEKEYETAKAATRQIEKFIKDEICPRIRYEYEIPVGNEKTRTGRAALAIIIDNWRGVPSIRARTGSLALTFDESKPREFLETCVYDSWNFGGDFCFQLVANWPSVKRELLRLLELPENNETKRNAIFSDFQI